MVSSGINSLLAQIILRDGAWSENARNVREWVSQQMIEIMAWVG